MKKSLLLLSIMLILFSCSNLKTVKQNKLLRFHTDDNYLVLYLLINTKGNRISNQSYSQDILNFQNKFWDESKVEYELLLKKFNKSSKLTYLNFKHQYEIEYLSIIEKAKQLKEFQSLKRQTDTYKLDITKKWSEYFLKTKKIIYLLTGIEINKESHVIITHPGLKNGRELDGEWIEWGGYDDTIYTVTYLWHEVLHQYFDKSNLSHSIIELIADNELNFILTGNSYPPLRGHKKLEPIKKCLTADWNIYLSTSSKSIVNFMKNKSVVECGELFKSLKW